jgi:hypothetical protein
VGALSGNDAEPFKDTLIDMGEAVDAATAAAAASVAAPAAEAAPKAPPGAPPGAETTASPRPACVAVLEVLDRDGQVRQSFAVHAWPLSVGRALDNDVVLSDPHVASAHLRIAPGEQGLALTVGDTRNGVATGARRWRAGEQFVLRAAGAPIELSAGRTRLRLRLPGHTLPPELPLAAAAVQGQRLGLTLLAAGVVLAGLLFTTYLDSDPDALGRSVAGMLLAAVAGTALWCGLWSLLSKTFTRQTHFGWHLRVFLLASIAWMAVDAVPPLLAFALSWPALASYSFLASLAVGAAALYYHLLAVEPARPRLLRAVVGVGWLTGIALMMWFNTQRTGRAGDDLYMSHLFPPALRLARPVQAEQLVERLVPLQAVLDKKAKEAPSGDSNGAANED